MRLLTSQLRICAAERLRALRPWAAKAAAGGAGVNNLLRVWAAKAAAGGARVNKLLRVWAAKAAAGGAGVNKLLRVWAAKAAAGGIVMSRCAWRLAAQASRVSARRRRGAHDVRVQPCLGETAPASTRQKAYHALIKNPAWTMDTTGSYRPAAGFEIPPEAVWVKGLETMVVMMRIGDLEEAELLPAVQGSVRIGRRGDWQLVTVGWRFITPEWVFLDELEDGDTKAAAGGVGVAPRSMREFLELAAGGQDRIVPRDLSPYEFGSDLFMQEYRAEQEQIQADDKDRPKGASSLVVGILAATLIAMLMFSQGQGEERAPPGDSSSTAASSVEDIRNQPGGESLE